MKRLILFMLMALPIAMTAQEMKIISFNVRYNSAMDVDGENRWANRRDAVVKMIMDERPAAIGLQEALLNQLNDIDEQVDYMRVGVGRDDGKAGGEFMAIYYDPQQLELMSYETRWLSDKPMEPSKGWDAACKRTVTIARFHIISSGREFVYMNTHLDHVGEKARSESMRMLTSLVEQYGGEGTPVVLGGDMNSTLDNPIFSNLIESGLQEARSMVEDPSDKPTYNAFGKGEESMIDHFFVHEMNVIQFLTLDGDYGVPYISDHYPIEIIVNL